MISTCPHDCNNKTEYGYCKTTVCCHPIHGRKYTHTETIAIEQPKIKVVQTVEISDESIERIVDAVIKALKGDEE